jgi:ubiquinone/menaquinone biosynthesis C-methylase UbiE
MPSKQIVSAFDGTDDLFGHNGQAKMYHDFRPRYPEALVKSILSLVPEAGDRQLYIDVACGSGQLTELIGPFFDITIGFDRSFEQLSAVSKNNSSIKYQASSAFELPLESKSVDLLTVAQALHWLVPYERFFSEVERVLKLGGVFVTVAYTFPQVMHDKANAIVNRFYLDILGGHLHPGQTGCWWDTDRPTIDGFYSNIPFSRQPILKKFPTKVNLSIENYFNYLKTLSAYRTYLRKGNPDPLPAMQTEMLQVVGAESIDVEIPFFTMSYKV